MNDFRIGDLVTLRSGGLPMTIVKIRKRSRCRKIQCVWFESQVSFGQRMAVRTFPPAALIKSASTELQPCESTSLFAT
jgi:uncharacterized protein YodC (DUF2158 family)